MITDWDDAYANGAYIEGAQDFPPRWAEWAQQMRAALTRAGRAELDMPYGAGSRQKLDLFRPEGEAKGLFLFVHGGYWKSFDKSAWSHLAGGALARGWAVAMPEYTLAPQARIREITAEISRALAFAAARVAGPVHLAGHSAGGHLVARQACGDLALPAELRARIARVVSISGLHDLRPLLRTSMNDALRLDAAEAQAESPALLYPTPGAQFVAWVGAAERPEFLRQTDLLANIWTGLGADIRAVHVAGRHHFDVIDDLTDPDSELARLCAP